MSKIIPVFHLPKDNLEDMKVLAEGLVANDGQTVKSAVLWLQGKLVAHSGPKAGSPMSDTTIKNYLAGFYVLDLFKANNNFYRELTPDIVVSLPIHSKIEVIHPLKWVLEATSVESFKERLTQVCSQYSQIVKTYTYDRQLLKDKYELGEKSSPALIRKLLIEHCGYSHIGNPKQNNPVGYLEIFYQDKVEIDNYIKLLDFIQRNYGDSAKKTLGLIPIANIMNHLKEVSHYTEEEFKQQLIQLQLTHRIELRTTKSQLARNMGIELIDIRGVNYGFIKLLEPAMAV